MSHGGGRSSGQGSCTSVSLGKYVRRALRAASGRRRIKDKPKDHHLVDGGGVSLELISSSSSSSERRDSVVRVVLSSGVVEVYTGVVLAITVIRNHPPGLCLAHPDVFRNPHGARVRPFEPLFPGQKFLLLPESTIEKLQRNIPEGSVGAFDEEEEANREEEDGDGSEEVSSSTETSSSEGQDHSGGGASSSEERQTEPAAAGDDDGAMLVSGCCAREYFVAKERWAECQFKRMVARGLAVEQSAEPAERKEKGIKKKKKKMGKKRKDPAAAPSAGCTGCRTFGRVAATPRRAWEPSLPSVEEEEIIMSPLQPPPSESRTDHETS